MHENTTENTTKAIKMCEEPDTLQKTALNFICENLQDLCETYLVPNPGGLSRPCMRFKSRDVYLPGTMSDEFLDLLCQKKKLNDDTMTLFHPETTCLKRVNIRNAPLTKKGLRMLRQHKIVELEAVGLKQVTVNDLIGCLGEWTLTNLLALNVMRSTLFQNVAEFCVIISLSKLRNLRSLNVSHTEFNKNGLAIIAEDLPALESLDISSTLINDLSPLRKCKDRLKYLSMYNLRAMLNRDVVAVLCELKHLVHLDVSDDFSVQPFVSLQTVKFQTEELLKSQCLPNLTSLDISGKDGIKTEILWEFLVTHPEMKFLGLALTDICDKPMFTDPECPQYTPHLRVTGEANEKQLLESLRRYTNRAIYVQRTLFHLFTVTQFFEQPRVDIIKLILPAMAAHPHELGVQMAATACLYNLSKQNMGQRIHPRWLAQMVHLTMTAMRNFPNHQQLQKNALLTLCSDRILQDVTFDRFLCARLVMDCLCSFEDHSMNRMSVAICGILAAKIPTDQTSQLGAKATYMRKLLAIVREKTDSGLSDITMRFTLSALWNLTDESPQTCQMFLDEHGLELFIQVLQTFKTVVDDNRVQVETKVLGLINNLAEVKQLRPLLMREDIIGLVRELLRADHLDVSYFAAGIVSHLCSDGDTVWNVPGQSRQDVLIDLGEAVSKWEQPAGEMVAYRSFSPFFPLLQHHDAPQLQLWAVWAMQHVCTKNRQRYCSMLIREGGQQLLEELVAVPSIHPHVRKLAASVLQLIHEEQGTGTSPTSPNTPAANP